VMNITDKQSEYVDEVVNLFKDQGIRASKDLRNEKIGFKIREHTLRRVPYLLVIGDQEMENREVAVRTRDGVDLGKMRIEDFAAKVKEQISLRSLNMLEE
ncbi:His/Gly/Thr/Pro-type tRNA ligase C-terminal domain-containing protein, partial [Shewanella colwelliana]